MNILFQRNHQRGFGTYPLKGEALEGAIADAVAAGYRAFDSAQMYQNEADTGAALAASGIGRGELCITTKVDPANFSDESFMPSVESSLKALQVDQVDVLLLHWPPPGGDVGPSLRLLQRAFERGLARNIGVSNYTPVMMRVAASIVDAPLVTNQVEFHPLLDQSELLAAASETGIPLSSYCSLARGELFKYPLFARLAADYGRTPAQIALRWILQTGVPVNTMSTKAANIAANYDVMDFTLSSVDMGRIGALTATGYRIVRRFPFV